MKKILFVCLGNICRSPLAEGIFQSMIEEQGLNSSFSCDSAGTSAYHIGSLADERMRNTALKYDVRLTHKARQIIKADLENFDFIIAMDTANYSEIKFIQNQEKVKSKILMMRDFDPEKNSIDVPDPYFGGMQGFEDVYQMLLRCNEAFLDYLKKEFKIKI